MSALAPHLVQASITYLNTILIQTVVRDAKGRRKPTPIDLRGLSALFWTHLNLYGRLELDMNRHLDLDPGGAEQRQGDGDAAPAEEERREQLGGQHNATGGLGVAGGVEQVGHELALLHGLQPRRPSKAGEVFRRR
ncbi:Tn3 family transposase [Nonomuraea sp. NPDC049419]|uniref:Tn3 family transposase n=1 Tax=Nonomuraea sp. NPDC049419 TaxID=3155772 RepID=UPI00342F8910